MRVFVAIFIVSLLFLSAVTSPASAEAPKPTAAPASWTEDLKLSGFVQAQFLLNQASKDGVDSQGRPQNKDRFEVRRGRAKLTYTHGAAEAVLHIDALPTGVRVLEAEASWKLHWQGDAGTKLTAGLFRIPFGYELQESMSVHPFPERSIWANRFFPGVRDVGARVWGTAWSEALIYQLALQNGQPISDALFPGLEPNSAKDLTARIGTHLGRLRAGVSALVGTGYLAPVADDPATTADETEGRINYERYATGADLVVTFDVPALGELGLYTEVVYGRNMDRSRPEDLPQRIPGKGRAQSRNAIGAYVGALQHLGSLFALGARLDYFDRDTSAGNDQQTAVDLVAHVYPAEALRLTAAYELHFEEPSVDDNQLWLRAQVKY